MFYFSVSVCTVGDETQIPIHDYIQDRQFFLRMRSVMSRRGTGGKGKVVGFRVSEISQINVKNVLLSPCSICILRCVWMDGCVSKENVNIEGIVSDSNNILNQKILTKKHCYFQNIFDSNCKLCMIRCMALRHRLVCKIKFLLWKMYLKIALIHADIISI